MEIKFLQSKLKEKKVPDYRLKQALRSYYQDLLAGWEEISTWPKALRTDCQDLSWSPLTLISVLESKDPASTKFLFKLPLDKGGKGGLIEAVVMRHKDGRNTVCISSQAGCSMGCTFCATGAQGLGRNLTAEEIVDQVVQAARWLSGRRTSHVPIVPGTPRPKRFSAAPATLPANICEVVAGCGRVCDAGGWDGGTRPQRQASALTGAAVGRVTNIVFMGMGEPFNNSDEVFNALKRLMDPDMFGLGARHISISTCGIIPGIQRLAKEAPQVNLAISLHAPGQDLRAGIMPVARAYPLDKLMHTVRDYLERTNRKVMFEYVMLKGVNDSPENAEELADLLIDFRHLAHVNLIKYHRPASQSSRVPTSYEPSNQDTRRKFANVLKRRGIAVTERTSFGEEINAACGQLAGQTPNTKIQNTRYKKQDTNKLQKIKLQNTNEIDPVGSLGV